MKKATLTGGASEQDLSPRYAAPRIPMRVMGQPFEDSSRPTGHIGVRALTSREKEILKCLSEGMTTRALAEKLSISSVTVRNHIQRILKKLGVHSKLAAVVCAYRNKLN
jgi:DNA-binding NarL/FixJ family response regulator